MERGLSKVITDEVVRRLAGERTYERGLEYFSGGQVGSVVESDGAVAAVVRGDQDYRVTLSADEGVPDYSCDCPVGAGGTFCKHCVAVALSLLARAGAASVKPAAVAVRRKAEKKVTLAHAAKALRSEDRDKLVGMVMEWARDDKRLRDRLLLYAARKAGPDSGAAAVRKALEKAIHVRDFLSYREVPGWAKGIDKAIDVVAQLLKDGQADAVIEVCESGLGALVRAVEQVDDSDGHFGELRDRLQDLHRDACREARPDPVELAGRLFEWEMRDEWDVFHGAAQEYAEILGPDGLEVYRNLAEAEWAKVPVRTAKDGRSEWGRHFRITHVMESLARVSGDVEQLVGVMSRDLTSAYAYLEIATVYQKAGDDDRALAWAEDGLKALPERTDIRLREFAAAEYHRRGRHVDAMRLVWADFREDPDLKTYARLRDNAQKAGCWPEWRERGLAEIRRGVAKEIAAAEKRSPKQSRWFRPDVVDHSALVEIFFYEGNVDEAWREAEAGGCRDALWLRLAEAREKEHPEDAAPIFLRLGEQEVERVSSGRYEDGVALLVKAAAVMKVLGRSGEFVGRLEVLRARFKVKRNFMALVEKKRSVLYLG